MISTCVAIIRKHDSSKNPAIYKMSYGILYISISIFFRVSCILYSPKITVIYCNSLDFNLFTKCYNPSQCNTPPPPQKHTHTHTFSKQRIFGPKSIFCVQCRLYNQRYVVHAFFLWSDTCSPDSHPGGRKALYLQPNANVYPSRRKTQLFCPAFN